MYDKVKMTATIDREQALNVSVLDELTGDINLITGEITGNAKGKYRNLSIHLHPDSIIIEGSLAKYYFGNNIDMLDRELTEKAIKQLSNELWIDLQYAQVTQFEIGANFEMSQPVQRYFDILGECPRMIKGNFGNSVYFQGKAKKENIQRILKFYDKGTEAKKKKEVPLNYDIKNILRFEILYKHNFKQQLGTAKVYAYTLYDKEFYTNMVQRYYDTYMSISKHKELNIEWPDNIKTPKDILKLAFKMYAEGSQITVDDIINSAKSNNTFPGNKRKYYCDARKLIEQWLSDVKVTKTDVRVKELDQKVKDLCEKQKSI